LSKSLRRRALGAGFTLVELLTVVAITGILATVGVVLVRNHLSMAKANRALSGLQALSAAEVAFRAENGRYLDCSGTTARWYPMLIPGKTLYDWRQTHADGPCWQALGLPRDSGTQYGYLLHAGLPGVVAPVLATAAQPVLGTSPEPWFVIQVKGDLDGDGVFLQGFATSWSGEVYLENEGE